MPTFIGLDRQCGAANLYGSVRGNHGFCFYEG
jgi:hypothetical protein